MATTKRGFGVKKAGGIIIWAGGDLIENLEGWEGFKQNGPPFSEHTLEGSVRENFSIF